MRKNLLLAAGLLCAGTLFAAEQAETRAFGTPEFHEEEWNYVGVGSVEPGFADCFGTDPDGTIEWQETLATNVWEKKATPGDFYIEYITESIPDTGKSWIVPDPIFLHAQNHDQVYVEQISYLSPMIFCWYQAVPEIMGKQGNSQFYGKMDSHGIISFPAGCFVLTTLPTGYQYSNLAGNFSLEIPEGASVKDLMDEAAPAEYYDLNGMRVENPSDGLFVMKQGNKVSKILVR